MLKRTGTIVLALAFISLAVAPETLACHRNRRASFYRPAATYYRPYSGAAGARYARPYYGYPSNGYYGQRYYRGHSTRNLVLTVVGPAAVGAGIGAIAGGGKGAGIGGLIGGGGGALYYLVRHHGRRY